MGAPGFPEPRWPALAQLLSRAHCKDDAADTETLRYRLFGYALSESQDYPDAWLSYQVDTGTVACGALLRADPVHLRADQQHLLLFDAAHLNITADEAQALVAAFNQHYATDGLRLEAPTPTRWYLHLSELPELRTTSLLRAIGRDIDPYLPTGQDAHVWRQRLNEMQMLFHHHPVNRAREARGQALINSVWLWGGGRPLPPIAHDWQRVWVADTTLLGLAQLNGIRCAHPPADARVWLHEVLGDRHLVCLEAAQRAVSYGELESWFAQVEQIEVDWIVPLLAALRGGQLRELLLYPSDGHAYRVTRSDLWRFWRRRRLLLKHKG